MLLNDAAYRFNNTAAFRLMIHSRHTLISDREVVMAQRCNKFQPRLPVFISHAQTRNMHFWMMKAGSAARHESNMDHIKRLFLPLKSGGRASGPRTRRHPQTIQRGAVLFFSNSWKKVGHIVPQIYFNCIKASNIPSYGLLFLLIRAVVLFHQKYHVVNDTGSLRCFLLEHKSPNLFQNGQ